MSKRALKRLEKDFFIEKLFQKALEGPYKRMPEKELQQKLKKAYPAIYKEAKRLINQATLRNAKSILKLKNRDYHWFLKRLKLTYQPFFHDLDVFIELSKQIAEDSHGKYLPLVVDKDLRKFDVLIRIHSRACQVASEIFTLVTHGYPDGALARWRTIHELTVTFLVLAKSEPEISRMYEEYEDVESFKKAKSHMKTYKSLGWRKIHIKRIQNLEASNEKLKALYGKDYLKANGWACSLFPPKQNIEFWKLEEMADMHHLRFLYVWACDNVHSGVSGVKQRLGLMDGDNGIFMGASNFGIADPAQFTTYSLLQMNLYFLQMNSSIKNEIVAEILKDMQTSISQGFMTVQNSLALEEIDSRKRKVR